VLLNATNASRRPNYPLASKGVEIRASTVANSLSIGQSTLATIINSDLSQPKLGPKIAPKKGTRPLKSIVARPALAPGALKAAPKVAPKATLKAAPKATLKATLKATIKGVIGKKALPKVRITPLKRPAGKINKR
jgi:hypothetical protein